MLLQYILAQFPLLLHEQYKLQPLSPQQYYVAPLPYTECTPHC